ncbi:MAG TPA: hypothetical protein VGD50_02785, partial [Candidatus Baltobacteraceae bacterium]
REMERAADLNDRSHVAPVAWDDGPVPIETEPERPSMLQALNWPHDQPEWEELDTQEAAAALLGSARRWARIAPAQRPLV